MSSIFGAAYELGATAPLPLFPHIFLQIGIQIVVWQKIKTRDASMKNMTALAVLIFPNDVLLQLDWLVYTMFAIVTPNPANIKPVIIMPLNLYKRLKGLYKIKKYTIILKISKNLHRVKEKCQHE